MQAYSTPLAIGSLGITRNFHPTQGAENLFLRSCIWKCLLPKIRKNDTNNYKLDFVQVMIKSVLSCANTTTCDLRQNISSTCELQV